MRPAAWASASSRGQIVSCRRAATGGAQLADGAGRADGGGERDHDRVFAGLAARCPGGAGGALRAGHGAGVVVDGEVGPGVARPGAGLGGGVGQQRADQRDAARSPLDDQVGAEVARVQVAAARGQAPGRQGVVNRRGHLVIGHGRVGGRHMRDQVRVHQAGAPLLVSLFTRPGLLVPGRGAPQGVPAAGAGGRVVAGLADVQLVSQPEGVALGAPPGAGVIR